jgi:hypothetical protein
MMSSVDGLAGISLGVAVEIAMIFVLGIIQDVREFSEEFVCDGVMF